MKRANTVYMLCLFGVYLTMNGIFAGCASPANKVEKSEQKVTEARQDLTLAQQDYAEELSAFREETGKRITANDTLIADLRASMKRAGSDAREDYKEKINDVQNRNDQLRKRLGDYKEDGNQRWDAFKEEFNRDMDDLGKSLKDFSVDNK